MSTAAYKKNDWVMRTVHYRYMQAGEWKDGDHKCYEKTDDEAIISCYKNAVPALHDTFHVTGIDLKIFSKG